MKIQTTTKQFWENKKKREHSQSPRSPRIHLLRPGERATAANEEVWPPPSNPLYLSLSLSMTALAVPFLCVLLVILQRLINRKFDKPPVQMWLRLPQPPS